MNASGTEPAAERSLAGASVMVTRAPHQAATLSNMIEVAGGRAVRLPVLEIADTANIADADRIIGRLAEFDIAIFISQNAVRFGHARMQVLSTNFSQVKLAAIGEKTAAALKKTGSSIDLYPRQGFTTEDLLELPEMNNVYGRRIVIFRGEGGRALLGATLRARGATVVYAEVYRRIVPRGLPAALRQCLGTGAIDIITIASGEALLNLDEACAAELRVQLHQTCLLVGNARIRARAAQAGYKNIDVAANPGDDAMFENLLRWAARRMPAAAN